jgi:transcription antitermination factor NusA-like protein
LYSRSLRFACVHPPQELVLLLEEVQKGAAVYGKVPVLVSRNKPEMPAAILSTLVGEIMIGDVRIAATAREPGFATKLAVEGMHSSVRDPLPNQWPFGTPRTVHV